MKYVVICYSVHDKQIASYDDFDNIEDACEFLEKDAQNTYEEEYNNSSDEMKEQIDFTFSDDGTAYLSSCDGEYEWTWEIIEITEKSIREKIWDYINKNLKSFDLDEVEIVEEDIQNIEAKINDSNMSLKDACNEILRDIRNCLDEELD